MPDPMLDRRQCLRLIGAGIGLLGGSIVPFSGRLLANPENGGTTAFTPDLEVQLTAAPATAPILPGPATRVWRFRGKILRGDPDALVQDEQSYLGPTFKVQRGQKIRVRLRNDIPQPTVVHWHGLMVNDRADGHPRFAFAPGETVISEFEVINRAGTYWYHPHPHGLTGPQVYGGLAGMFCVSDASEQALNLPSDEHDLPLVIQDRRFDAQNQLVYLQHPMDRVNGFLGNRILVNGRTDAVFSVASRPYRLRLLNGSNARVYRLAWDDGRPLIVIGTDGGFLAQPVRRPASMLGPGERLDLWADFDQDPPGSRPSLVSLPFDGGGGAMGGMMGRGRMGRGAAPSGGPQQGAPFKICSFDVGRSPGKGPALPERLAPPVLPHAAEAVNYGEPKAFFLEMRGMQWTINGHVFRLTDVAPDEQVRFGTSEIWDFVNRGGAMMSMMDMPHPMHLHGVQFRILERSGGPDYEFFDEGWQDTTLVWPGQTVRILVPFEAHTGLFLYHCHNLEHEDQGMMRNFEIL